MVPSAHETQQLAGARHDPTADRAVALLRDLDSLKTGEPLIAKPLERLVARLIDLTGLFTATVLALTASSFVKMVVSGGLSESEQRDLFRPPTTRESLVMVVGTVAILMVYETVTMARRGQTPGKQLMGLRVVTVRDRQKPGWPRTAARCLVWAIPFSIAGAFWSPPITYGATIPLLVIWLWALWDKDHRGVHDIVAGTVVIRPR